MQLKILGKNTIIYSLGNVCLRAASFLLIPVYTHALSLSDFGLFANLLLTIQVMIFFMSVGSQTGLVRYMKEYEEKNMIGKLLGSTFCIVLIAIIAISTICLSLTTSFSIIFHTEIVAPLIWLACVAAGLQSLCIVLLSYYRARGEAYKFSIASFITVPLMLILNIVFLFNLNLGVKGGLLAYIAAYGTMLVVLIFNIIPKTGLGFSSQISVKLLKFGVPLSFSMSSWLIMGSSAIYFLSCFSGLEIAGIYSLGQKFARISNIILLLPFQLAFEPFIFQNLNHDKINETIAKMLTYFLLAFSFVAFLIVVGTRILLPLAAPPEYQSAYVIVIWLLPVVIFEGIYSFGGSLLQIVKKTYIMGFASIFFMIISLLLNYFLIPRFGWYGAILSLNVTYIAAGLTVLVIGIKVYPISLEFRRIFISTLVTLLFIFFSFYLKAMNIPLFICINIMLVSAAGLFFHSVNFLNVDEKIFIGNFINKIRLRLSS